MQRVETGKQYPNGNEIMSIRCKVCNELKSVNSDKVDSSTNWECKNCGSVFDADNNYVTVQ